MIPDLARAVAATALIAAAMFAVAYALSWLAIKAIGEVTDADFGDALDDPNADYYAEQDAVEERASARRDSR